MPVLIGKVIQDENTSYSLPGTSRPRVLLSELLELKTRRDEGMRIRILLEYPESVVAPKVGPLGNHKFKLH